MAIAKRTRTRELPKAGGSYKAQPKGEPKLTNAATLPPLGKTEFAALAAAGRINEDGTVKDAPPPADASTTPAEETPTGPGKRNKPADTTTV